ncbi:hypothetical protein [uncultured Solobacterium sp.]|uniref:hypothetical protein n=1 Tax=uncultured Solobacterium sp. TaxID=747375 RepID=UPI0025D28637|nr:hypothetical protein [uncultured Solobacterium sp.]
MKRIKLILILAVASIVIIIIGYFMNWLTLDAILSNLLFGFTASIITALLLEYLSNEQSQRNLLKTFLWQGIIRYKEDLEEIFLYARIFSCLEKLFENIPKDENDWVKYHDIYLKNKKILNPEIEGFTKEIKNKGMKYSDHIAYLSDLLANIDRNKIFKENHRYKKCYELYRLVENINWTLSEANTHLQHIEQIKNSEERMCSELIICRWVSDLYCNNYDRKIEDINDVKEDCKDIKVKKDFKKLIEKFISDIPA